MKKVILFCDYFGNGGIEKVITNIKNNVNNEEYSFSILTTIFDSNQEYEFKKISNSKTINPLFRFITTIFHINKYTIEADIVHLNMHSSIDLLYACLIDKNKEIIVHAHNSDFQNNKFKIKTIINNLFKLLFNRKRFKYIACSKEAKEFCFGKRQNCKIIRNNFDSDTYKFNKNSRKKLRKKYHISDSTYVIGNVGRLVKQKNHLFLIKIFNEFNKLNPDSLLFIIGNGIMKKDIIECINHYKLEDKVVMIEYISGIEEYYQIFDSFVSPSLFEGYGLCIQEALYSSLKCFVTEKIINNFEKNDNLIALSLDKNEKYWANVIYNNMKYERKRFYIKDNFITTIEQVYGSEKDKISIILPVYNNEKTINRCIESIINQSYKNFELIIINDGSKDNTLSILKKHKDSRIKIINQKNHGTGHARNVGINKSKGKYITFIDSDDEITQDYLHKLYNLLILNDCDISCSAFYTSRQDKDIILDKYDAFSMLLDLPENIGVGVTRKLFKKEIIENIKFDEENHFEDIDFSIKAFLNTEKVSFTYKKLYICHKNKKSRSSFFEGEDRINACLSVFDLVANSYPSLFNKYITYSLFNMIGTVNMMILNEKYINNTIKKVKKYIKKYLKRVDKTNYPLYKKFQIYLFNNNYKLYKKLYRFLKELKND